MNVALNMKTVERFKKILISLSVTSPDTLTVIDIRKQKGRWDPTLKKV